MAGWKQRMAETAEAIKDRLGMADTDRKARKLQLELTVSRGRQAEEVKRSPVYLEWFVPYIQEVSLEHRDKCFNGNTPEEREEARVAMKTLHDLMVVRIDRMIEEGRKATLELTQHFAEKPKTDEAVK